MFDPSYYAERKLTAGRTLEQVNGQLQQLQTTITRTQNLLNEAQNIAYQVSEIVTI